VDVSAAAAAAAYLRATDPVMGALVERHGVLEPRPARGAPDLYGALVRSIVGQQLSVFAARSIWNRLADRYGGRAPTPDEVLADDPEKLRAAAGLSRMKVQYLRSLAEHVRDGSLLIDRLARLDDDEVIAELTQVKGLGVWTAHMFLIFTLGRPDVLATGDLGVRRAAERAYGLPALPAAPELEALAEPWRPWRSVACRYLWASLANAPV
jgi:DNA-3-methyladenine glycosylase II